MTTCSAAGGVFFLRDRRAVSAVEVALRRFGTVVDGVGEFGTGAADVDAAGVDEVGSTTGPVERRTRVVTDVVGGRGSVRFGGSADVDIEG